MISNGINPVQSPAQSLPARPAHLGKKHARHAEVSVDRAAAVPENASQVSTVPAAATLAGANPTVSKAFTAALSPITDGAQAAAATQHAGLLLRAQPRLALVAQANSSSQSVARLLQ